MTSITCSTHSASLFLKLARKLVTFIDFATTTIKDDLIEKEVHIG
jgi:hypothetical protein